MAKQTGPYFITGTIGGVVFYEMNGKYYAREKGSNQMRKLLDKKGYELVKRNCNLFGDAMRLASKVYQQVPVEIRSGALNREIQKRALELIRSEKASKEIEAGLINYLANIGRLSSNQSQVPIQKPEISCVSEKTDVQIPPDAGRSKHKSNLNLSSVYQPRTDSYKSILKHWVRVKRRRKYYFRNAPITSYSPTNSSCLPTSRGPD